MRGDAFSEENWSEMFSLMDLPNYERIKITDLKFGNVLQQSHQIVARMDHIKVFHYIITIDVNVIFITFVRSLIQKLRVK